MFRRGSIHWIACLVVLLILAGGERGAPHAEGQATAAVATPAATLTFGPGPFNLQPITGLAELSGYQATLNVDFTGNESGQPNPWTQTLTLLVRGKPSARALTAIFTGQA